jgi:squalene-associated FAD-dependent desaturase
MDKRTAVIIGGGLAGLSAAVFLVQKFKDNIQIKLYEASPKLGGRAYSFLDKERNMYFDNGQHILAGWYKDTFDYLKIIGTYEKLSFQDTLEVNFLDKGKNFYALKLPSLPAPYNFLGGLFNFRGFGLKDKLNLLKIKRLLNADETDFKGQNTYELLLKYKQGNNLFRFFWNPFILAVFNTSAENVDAEMFIRILKTSFLEGKSSSLIIPGVNLNELLIDNAESYLKANNAEIVKGVKINRLQLKEDKIEYAVDENGGRINGDIFISSVPFFAFSRLFEKNALNKYFPGVNKLRSSSIVSVHIFLKKDIPENVLEDNSFGMTGLIDTSAQWIFKRSPRHLSIIISGSDVIRGEEDEDALTGLSSGKIYQNVLNELNMCVNGFKDLEIEGYKVIKEKRATFIPDPESNAYRLKHNTEISNLLAAGDWTDTGLPATIESAVRSGKVCAELVE